MTTWRETSIQDAIAFFEGMDPADAADLREQVVNVRSMIDRGQGDWAYAQWVERADAAGTHTHEHNVRLANTIFAMAAQPPAVT